MMKKNIEPQISAYLHHKGYRLGLPIAGNFELTARCNFRCPMCYVHREGEQDRELTAGQWLSIAREARDAGMVFALLTGGEPFMRKDFFEIYRGMKELGLMISVNSNGSMLTGEILEKLLEDPPFRVNISLYGGSNETYRRMCASPAYDRVKENIRTLKAAGVDVSLNLSITPFNHGDLPKIHSDAVELDVNVRGSAYMYPPVRVNGEQYGCGERLTAEEAARCALQWEKLRLGPEEFAAKRRNTQAMVQDHREGCPVEMGEGIGCRAGSTSFWITWDGKMMPCGMMTTPVVHPLDQGFTAAWQQLREETARIRLPKKCAACANKQVCSVCAAVCLAETGSFDGVPAYMCEKTEKQIRFLSEGDT